MTGDLRERAASEAELMEGVVLLPCTFCGTAADVHENDWCVPSEWSVDCNKCFIHMSGADDGDYSKEGAIKAWNHRAVIPVAAQGWRPISEAPKGKVLLMWAATDVGADGEFKNWKMATGAYDFSGTDLWWDGQRLDKPYHVRPTHWQPLPSPPSPDPSEESRDA